jgi:hypothetical protein
MPENQDFQNQLIPRFRPSDPKIGQSLNEMQAGVSQRAHCELTENAQVIARAENPFGHRWFPAL